MRGVWRVFGRVVVAVQAVVAFALPVADAGAVHAPVAAHWEDASDTSCPPQHDQSTCATCQSGRLVAHVPADGAAMPASARVVRAGRSDTGVRSVGSPTRGTAASRAPPAA